MRVGAYSSLTGQAITLEMAKNVLRDLIGTKKSICPSKTSRAVGSKHHVKIADLKSRHRTKTAGASPPDRHVPLP